MKRSTLILAGGGFLLLAQVYIARELLAALLLFSVAFCCAAVPVGAFWLLRTHAREKWQSNLNL